MKKILMIDDEKPLDWIKKNPSDWDGPNNRFNPADVEIARSYDDGLKKLQAQKWDLLLLDHDLGPGKTGYDLMSWMEQNTDHLPASIMTISFNPSGNARMAQVIKKLEEKGLTRYLGHGV